jgi:hypothetical protein
MTRAFVVSLLFIASGFAQTRRTEIADQLEDLDFASGKAGDMPAVWNFGPDGAYRALIAAGAACVIWLWCA